MLKIGLIQMLVEESKEKNISKASEMIKKAAASGADFAVLPEMFNCPYDNGLFRDYGEKEGGYTFERLSKIAEQENVYLIGGSIPEIDDEGKVYNTSYIFDKKGNKIGKHRKMHLFDIDIPGGLCFKESDVLSPGDEVTVFETAYGRMGAAICFDIRFPELSRLMTLEGAKIIFVPGAFNMTTGPAHWELHFRARALDNQVYTVGVAPARNLQSSYTSYGNSIIADPWGSVVNRMGHEEGVLVEEVDLTRVDKVRRELPLLSGMRHDIYRICR